MSNLPSKLKGLHILLNCIERNESRKVMCQLLNISNQSVGRKLSTLKAKGYIEQIHSRPTSTYKMLSLGSQVSQILIQSDGMMSGFYKCHHKIVGYIIEDYGNWQFNDKLWVTMKGGWHYQKARIKDHIIRVQDTGKMVIICPKTYSKNPKEAFGNMVESAMSIGRNLAQNYGMKLGNFIEIREGHKELIGSNAIADMLGYLKIGNFWIDESGGSKNFEEMENTNSIEDLLKLPQDIAELRKEYAKNLTELSEVNKALTEQIRLHLDVLQDMKVTLKDIRDEIKNRNGN